MRFIKGVFVGSIITTGITMLYSNNMNHAKKRMVKTGKLFMKKMGIM